MVDAKAFFEKINSQVSSDLDAVEGLIDIVVTTLLNALKKELLVQFENKMYQIDSDIKKSENMKEANQMFQDAEDTETIIQHMTTPIVLERYCFERKY